MCISKSFKVTNVGTAGKLISSVSLSATVLMLEC